MRFMALLIVVVFLLPYHTVSSENIDSVGVFAGAAVGTVVLPVVGSVSGAVGGGGAGAEGGGLTSAAASC